MEGAGTQATQEAGAGGNAGGTETTTETAPETGPVDVAVLPPTLAANTVEETARAGGAGAAEADGDRRPSGLGQCLLDGQGARQVQG